MQVRVTYGSAKPQKTLDERGSDFKASALVFKGITVEVEDVRKEYGVRRMIWCGKLWGRKAVVGCTQCGAERHVFSMRKANDREQARLAPYFGN